MNAATGQEKTRSPGEAPGAPGALLRQEGQPPAVADPARITRAGQTTSVTSFCVDKPADSPRALRTAKYILTTITRFI